MDCGPSLKAPYSSFKNLRAVPQDDAHPGFILPCKGSILGCWVFRVVSGVLWWLKRRVGLRWAMLLAQLIEGGEKFIIPHICFPSLHRQGAAEPGVPAERLVRSPA